MDRPNPHGRQLGRTAVSWTNNIGSNEHFVWVGPQNPLQIVFASCGEDSVVTTVLDIHWCIMSQWSV